MSSIKAIPGLDNNRKNTRTTDAAANMKATFLKSEHPVQVLRKLSSC